MYLDQDFEQLSTERPTTSGRDPEQVLHEVFGYESFREATDHIQKFLIVDQAVDSSAGFFVRIGTDGIKFLHGSPVVISVCHSMA